MAVALAAGILTAGVVSSVWWILVPVVFAVVALILRRRYSAIMVCAYALGWFLAFTSRSLLPPQVTLGENASYSGVIIEYRELMSGQALIVRIDSCDGMRCAPFSLAAVVPQFTPLLAETDRIAFSATLHPIRSHQVLPDEADEYGRLARLGVGAEGYIRPDSFSSISPAPGLLCHLRRFRHTVQKLIVDLSLPVSTQNFLIATLTADRTYLHPDIRGLYASSGIAHILALSGLHVAIIMSCILVVLSPLRLLRLHWLVRLVTAVLLWIFAVITGLTPSVVRAVIMATVWLASCQLQRRHVPLNSLAFAAIILLVASPDVIYSVGFQLTFMAVIGIVMMNRIVSPHLPHSQPARAVVSYFAMTLGAVLATGIISAFYFNRFPLLFLIANIPVALLLPFVLGGGLLLIALKALGLSAHPLSLLVTEIHSLIDSVARFLTSLPVPAIDDISLEPWEVGAYFVVLLFGYSAWMMRSRLMAMAALSVGIIALVCRFALPCPGFNHAFYITQSRTETSAVIHEGRDMRLFTTARGWLARQVLADDSSRYRRYMLRRDVASFSLLSPSDSMFPARLSGNLLIAHGHSFMFVSHSVSTDSLVGISPDYLVVCRGFKGDVCALAEAVDADSVLLSYDLNSRRHDSYFARLSAAGFRVRSLRHSPFVLR